MTDPEIYASEEYKARIDRARRSLSALDTLQALATAAESIAYWQMRAISAERLMLPESNRHD